MKDTVIYIIGWTAITIIAVTCIISIKDASAQVQQTERQCLIQYGKWNENNTCDLGPR